MRAVIGLAGTTLLAGVFAVPAAMAATPAAHTNLISSPTDYLNDRLAWIQATNPNPGVHNCLRLTWTSLNGAGNSRGNAVLGYLGQEPDTSQLGYPDSPEATYTPQHLVNLPGGAGLIPAQFAASSDTRYSDRWFTYNVTPDSFANPATNFSPLMPDRDPTTVAVQFGSGFNPPEIQATVKGVSTTVPITGENDGVVWGSSDTESLQTAALVKATCANQQPPPR